MGYADDETRGIPRAMHANGFSRPTRREARLREERERERGERSSSLLVASSTYKSRDGDGRTNRRSNSANTRWLGKEGEQV